MVTEKLNIRMDSVFSDDKKHRFLLRRSWGREGLKLIKLNSQQHIGTDEEVYVKLNAYLQKLKCFGAARNIQDHLDAFLTSTQFELTLH